jgi:hypothetical protein
MAFKRRCRYDIFIQRRLRHVQDQAIISLADDYGYSITISDLRLQRQLAKRSRNKHAKRGGLVFRFIYRFKRLIRCCNLFRWHHPS